MTPARLNTIAWLAIAWLVTLLLRTAWVCDDAYISFRTADNIVNGYGPVWNTAERVQAYTHPLWLAVFTTAYAVTREPYYTSIFLSMAITLAAVFLLRRLAPSTSSFLVALAALLSSKALIDYSTSGLENTLSHLLLLAFVGCWWLNDGSRARLTALAFTGALCTLTRLDLAVLVAPALGMTLFRSGPRRAVVPFVIGFTPLLLWEAFSLFYYGSLVPNTAYAKLNIADSSSALMQGGIRYLHRSLITDPVTVLAPIAAVAGALRWRRSDWPLVVGIALYVVYVVRIGGDFMAGRFLTAPLLVSVALLARLPVLAHVRHAAAAAAVVIVVGLLAPWEPAIISGVGYVPADNWLRGRSDPRPRDGGAYIGYDSVIDERRYYFEGTGLLKGRLGEQRPDHPGVGDGLALRQGAERVVIRDSIGFVGYFAGPQVHIIDMFALSDPLLARLEAPAGSRTGHYRRDIPGGYVESVAAGTNLIVDPQAAALYDQVRMVTSGPLWDWARLRAIAALLLD